MLEAVLGLAAMAIAALLLGAGWASVLRRAAPEGTAGQVFLSWTCAILITSIVWGIVYPANLDVRWGIGLTLGAAAAGYGVALKTGTLRRHAINLDSLVGLALAVVVTIVALIPAINSPTQLSVGSRIGPDAFGYAITAAAIDGGVTKQNIDHSLLRQVRANSVGQAVSSATKLVNTSPSLSTQVQAEFLEGADRWSFSGTAGSIVRLIGLSHLWSVVSLMSAFGLLTACLGTWAIVQARTRSRWAGFVGIALLGMNVAVLNSWHEGALAQIWVLPASILLASALLQLSEGNAVGSGLAVAIGTASILPAYNEAILPYAILFTIAMVFSIPLLRRTWWKEWWPLLVGGICGSSIVLASTLEFVSTFARSLDENGSAGWPVPHWIGPAEAFGISNAFGSSTPSLSVRSSADSVFVRIGDAVIALFVLSIVARRILRPAVIVLASVAVAIGSIYVKTRYLDHSSDYQYFKAIAMLCPAGALAIGVLVGDALTSVPIAGPRALRFQHRQLSQRPSLASVTLSGFVAAAVVASGIGYVVSFRQEGTTVPTPLLTLASSMHARSIFDRYNVLAPVAGTPSRVAQARLAAIALAAPVDLYWVGRNLGDPPTNMTGRATRPVALLVLEQDCPKFRCLAKISPDLVPIREYGVALVRLSSASAYLLSHPEVDWVKWATSRYNAVSDSRLSGLVPISGHG